MAKLRGFKDSKQKTLNKMLDMAIEFINKGELELAKETLKCLKKPL